MGDRDDSKRDEVSGGATPARPGIQRELASTNLGGDYARDNYDEGLGGDWSRDEHAPPGEAGVGKASE